MLSNVRTAGDPRREEERRSGEEEEKSGGKRKRGWGYGAVQRWREQVEEGDTWHMHEWVHE